MIIPQINILCVIDVIGALKAQSLVGNYYMMDNSRSLYTTGQGTEILSSAVSFEQVMNWHVMPIDVQTDVFIADVSFELEGENAVCSKLKKYGAPSGDYWAGIINPETSLEAGIYPYKMTFDMGRKLLEMELPASLNIAKRAGVEY